MMIRTLVATLLIVNVYGNVNRKWDFMQPQPVQAVKAAAPAETAFPAWYHIPTKGPQHSPSYGSYDRRDGYERNPPPPQTNGGSYGGFSGYNRPAPASAAGPPTYGPGPEAGPVTPRRNFPPQDGGTESAIEKYHKLLLKKGNVSVTKSITRRPFPYTSRRRSTTRSTVTTLAPGPGPVSLGPRNVVRPKEGPPRPPLTIGGFKTTAKPRTVRPIVNQIRQRLKLKKILPPELPTPPPETPAPEQPTSTMSTPPSFPVKKELVTMVTKPSRTTEAARTTTRTTPSTTPSTTTTPTTTSTTTSSSTTTTTRRTPTTTFRARFLCRHKPHHSQSTSTERDEIERERLATVGWFRPISTTTTRSTPTTSAPITTTTPSAEWSLFNLFSRWPNVELFAAIRDVVSKFKASLDESGLDQDVKHMSRQLQNTWQQLRSGNNGADRSWHALRMSAEQSLNPVISEYSRGPMNEQLAQLFQRSQAVADAPVRVPLRPRY